MRRAGRPVVATDPKAIVETISGKVRGYISNSVFTFKGIPYGGSDGRGCGSSRRRSRSRGPACAAR